MNRYDQYLVKNMFFYRADSSIAESKNTIEFGGLSQWGEVNFPNCFVFILFQLDIPVLNKMLN